jgi:hypothetical protein
VDLARKLLGVATVVLICACSGGTTSTPPAGTVTVTASPGAVTNDGTTTTISAAVTDAQGNPATGSVIFSAAGGDINATGTNSATVALNASGQASASYACNFALDATHCGAGSILVTATWSSVANGTRVTLQGATPPGGGGGGGGGGGSDAGVPPPPTPGAPSIVVSSVFPAFIVTSTAANPAAGLPGATTVSFLVRDANGAPFPGQSISFSQPAGENLITLGVTSVLSDANGVARVVATSGTSSGVAHVVGVLGNGLSAATATIPILGAPSIITWISTTPDVLGLKGSGIQEHGLMQFKVTDSLGTPVPQTQVNFAVRAPAVVTLNRTSSTTDENGEVVIDFSSGSEVGVTSIVATVASTGAQSAHSLAVRGARPSASNFYFRCEHASLPVYTTVTEHEAMKCTVRLADRYGNRVGVPTVVSFATEAGMIPASAITKGFDPQNPDDPDEGSVTVTFTSDIGNGGAPADVAPLATATQYPWNRSAEPSITYGSLVLNPRDQLVTLIAMTRGEEGFQDSNHNGLLDANEVFVDQGDPFIDANDDGVYDQVSPGPGGVWEARFCGLDPDCSVYHGPNGAWDSDTVIWKPTWVAFVDGGAATTTPAGGAAPGSDFTLPCADYTNASLPGVHESLIAAPVYVYDSWLNIPNAGTFVDLGDVTTDKVKPKAFGLATYLESWGSMGVLGFTFDYVRVAAAGPNAGQACTIANGQACVEKLLFRVFDDGLAGSVAVQNQVKAPDSTASRGVSTTGFGCAPNADQYGTGGFLLNVNVHNANNTMATTAYAGQFAQGD